MVASGSAEQEGVAKSRGRLTWALDLSREGLNLSEIWASLLAKGVGELRPECAG